MTHALRYLTPLALAISLAGCGHQADQTASDSGNAMTGAMDGAGNAMDGAGNAMSGAVDNAVNPVPTAQAFADAAAKSDAFEIAAGKLAQTNATAPGVKAFANKMIAAHTASTLKIKKAADAAAPAITPDATMTDDQTAKLADLGKMKGAEFDKAYVDGQIAAHEDALALMRNYADKGDSPTLKTAAGEIAPDVQDHLVMVRGLAIK